jgi:hypothetical protein
MSPSIATPEISAGRMDPKDSPVIFRERVSRAGLTLEKLTAAEALNQMTCFYREERAKHCVLETEGDMLLFAWKTHDHGKGETFHLEFTRQFIQPGTEDEDGMSQLYLRLHYPVTEELRAPGSGEHWCESPEEADAFEEFVLASAAYRAVVELCPAEVKLDWIMV